MRLFPTRAICAVFCLSLAVACAQEPATAPDTSAEDTAAIDAVRAGWVSAYNANDPAALAALFTEDGVSMTEDEPTATGRAAIQQMYASRFAMGTATAMVNSSHMQLMGDWAYDTGTFSGTLTPETGEAMTAEGRYVVILRREADGSWKIARDIDNSATPPMMPADQ